MYNYAAFWGETRPRPNLRLEAKTWTYHLGIGEVPDILGRFPAIYGGNPFKLAEAGTANTNLTGSPQGCVDGHHTVYDTNFAVTLESDPHTPLMPCFVKDLAGRTIYIGGPAIKGPQEWSTYGADRLTPNKDNLANPLIPLITFPRFCADAADMPGVEYLETILLTRFRTLDMSLAGRSVPSGAPEGADNVAMSYDDANLYPYKYRLDTFYIDGYKLPQTTMLFARSEGIRPTAAKTLGEDMVKKWDARHASQTYPEFLEQLGGEQGIEKLYRQGCTIIPTFEATNGFNVVSETFELEDYWPGRYVPGLHRVLEERDDTAPRGTIIEVLRPGFITATHIYPAQVVISSGAAYVSPNASNPAPLIPNLNLPHQRTLANWQATWLPTHPEHFEAPALWGFDLVSGHFLQLHGPLWDPLHYYYNCTDAIIQATKKPLDMSQNRWFIPVPESFEGRFHPIVPLLGFDVLSVEALERKLEQNRRPSTMVTRFRNGKQMADIGYHPLPMEFEYELESFWFPYLHPLNRQHGACPAELAAGIAPVITPLVSPEDYLEKVSAPAEAYWLIDPSRLTKPSDDPLKNYPQLMRFTGSQLPLEQLLQMIPLPFLADPGEELIRQPTETYFVGEDLAEDVAEVDGGIFDSWWDAREQGHLWVKFRHLLYRQAIELYALGNWFGATPLMLEELLVDWLKDDGGARELQAATRLRNR